MRSKAQIKAELEVELSSGAPDLDRVAELSAELKRVRGLRARLSRQRDVADLEAEPVRGLTEEDAAAVETWPAELRARLREHAFNRVIDGSTLDDPENWGVKNDLRRRGARP